jgi:hypothetical protein
MRAERGALIADYDPRRYTLAVLFYTLGIASLDQPEASRRLQSAPLHFDTNPLASTDALK